MFCVILIPSQFKTIQTLYEFFMKQNPIARDLRTSKYKMRVKKNTKKYSRKKSNDPFKLLVMALEKKTQLPDTAGKGVVKGDDVASMKDILEQGSKDA